MCYAALTKGMTAIATDILVTAHTMGLDDPLLAEWQLSQKDRYHTIERQLPVMPTKAFLTPRPYSPPIVFGTDVVRRANEIPFPAEGQGANTCPPSAQPINSV